VFCENRRNIIVVTESHLSLFCTQPPHKTKIERRPGKGKKKKGLKKEGREDK
jgi:hypothetical protein